MAESPRIISLASPQPRPPAASTAGDRQPLIIRLRNWVGDVTLGLPLLQRLDDAGYALTLIGKPWARDLLAGHAWPVHRLAGSLRERVRQLRDLRRSMGGAGGRIDAMSLPYSFSSALEMRLAGLRAIGYAHEGRGLLLARSVPRPPRLRHEMAIYWHLGSVLLGDDAPAPPQAALRLAPEHLEQAAALRRVHALDAGRYIVICPFAGGTFDKIDKCWPGFADFARQRLPSLGGTIVICPGPGGEEGIAARDFAGCLSLGGLGLGAYAALLRDAALVISNDTGPGHLAASVGAPLLSVLGPTDPAQWGARGPRVRIVQGAPGWPSEGEVLRAAQALLQPA